MKHSYRETSVPTIILQRSYTHQILHPVQSEDGQKFYLYGFVSVKVLIYLCILVHPSVKVVLLADSAYLNFDILVLTHTLNPQDLLYLRSFLALNLSTLFIRSL